MRYNARWRLTIAEQLISACAVPVGAAGREADCQSEASFSRPRKAYSDRSPKVAKLV
jgi:hypothetical protein